MLVHGKIESKVGGSIVVGLVMLVVGFGFGFEEEVGFVGLIEIAFSFGFVVVFDGLKDQREV